MWTLKCELRSIQDRSKWVWTLSQSELKSISDRSRLRSNLVWMAPKSLPASHADDYERSFNRSQTEILGQAAIRHAREFKEAWHSMDRSTFNRHIDIPTIYHQLKQTQNPRLSSLSSTTGTHPTNIRNATTSRKPTTGTFPTTTNINAQSTNDNKPVNHQPIRHSERLESQRRMSELDIKTPRNPRTSDEDSKHRSRKLKIINSKSREQNNLIIYIYIYMLFFYLVWRCPMTIRLLLGRLMKFRSFTFAPFLLVNHHGMLFNYLYSGGSLFITCSLFIFINITNLLLTVF